MSEGWTPIRPVSQAKARAVHAVVLEHFRDWTHDEDGNPLPEEELPTLHAPGTGWGEHWCVVWTGYRTVPPYEWPTLATIGGVEEYRRVPVQPAAFPPEVQCEAVNGSEMGIYPA